MDDGDTQAMHVAHLVTTAPSAPRRALRAARVALSTALATAITTAIATALAAAFALPADAAPADGDAALAALADRYFDTVYLPADPTGATLLGVHDHDTELPDLSAAGIARHVAQLQDFGAQFDAVDAGQLSEHAAADLALLQSNVRSSLLTLRTIKPWQTNPDTYPSTLAGSAYSLMQRNFAPANDRLRLLIARERGMPAVLDAGRANLRNPPPIFTTVALQQLPGTIAFFETDVPKAFAEADDPALRAAFVASNAEVVRALKAYGHWLKTDLQPKSHGDFRIGAATFREKLRDDEMVDTPLDALLAIGMADLRRNQAEFARVAKQLAPRKTARQVLADLGADHPPPAQLLASFQATFDGLTRFIRDRKIIEIPSNVLPTLQETPPFLRATTFASMDTPGPFEPTAHEAYFNVTLPEPGWPKRRTDEFMAQFNYPVISNVAVHEAFPGHYVQFLWMQRQPDRVRKILGAASNAEGWAHYCEQMLLDEGFGEVDVSAAGGPRDARRSMLLKLGQLQDALLRNARFVVGLRMHTGTMTFNQGVQFFVTEGYQSREVGRIETTRGTGDPTYLYYTLGKLQILKLRADLQAKLGSGYSLAGFHDAFMREGFAPIKLVRKALLHDDSPSL